MEGHSSRPAHAVSVLIATEYSEWVSTCSYTKIRHVPYLCPSKRLPRAATLSCRAVQLICCNLPGDDSIAQLFNAAVMQTSSTVTLGVMETCKKDNKAAHER